MDCSKSHAKCQAGCCSFRTPIPEKIWLRNQQHVQREIIHVEVDTHGVNGDGIVETHIIAVTDKQCAFLKEDLSCAIYDDRPWICKKFGDESCSFMTCSFQSKDGRIRNRQERRKIERQQEKAADVLANKLKMFESGYGTR